MIMKENIHIIDISIAQIGYIKLNSTENFSTKDSCDTVSEWNLIGTTLNGNIKLIKYYSM